MPRRNANALKSGLDGRAHTNNPRRVLHRKRCKCRPCRLRRMYELGIRREK